MECIANPPKRWKRNAAAIAAALAVTSTGVLAAPRDRAHAAAGPMKESMESLQPEAAVANGFAKPRGTVKVLDRAQLGGYIEETAVMPAGPHASQIAMTNGRTVYGVPMSAKSDAAIKPLFDSRAVGWSVPPKGMAYIESGRAFAFVEGGSPETLFRADRRGRPLPPTPIT
jgi:hypothetical protein